VDDSDQGLLAATAAGDADAFAVFFRRHEQAVTRFALRRCVDAGEVGDLVADTFLVALRRADDYRPQTEDALPWLLGIAIRIASGRRRAARVRLRLPTRLASATSPYTPEEVDAVVAAIDAAALAPDLEAALGRLPRREREVLELVAYDGLTPSEAAAALGLNANAARLRLSRARRHMREALEPDANGTCVPLDRPVAEESSHVS
jgi:RNA polymerase sigma-70 factor (ECF subfamily)